MTKPFIPIERECGPEVLSASPPLRWYVLIKEMEEFRARTGMGLAQSWGYVHREEYDAARRSFDAVRGAWGGAA